MKRNHFLAILLFTTLAGCSKKTYYTQPPVVTPEPEPPVAETLISLPAEWKKNTALTGSFPATIEVYQRTASFQGKAMNAWCVVFDPRSAALECKPVLAASNKKPSVLYGEESGTKYACLNAGFFGTNVSYSLVQYQGQVKAANIKSLTRTYNGASTSYYPTRGAFGLNAQGIPDITWIYHVGAGNGTVYSYTSPSGNALGSAPKPLPDASFPEGAKEWNVLNAVGGSPVLLKNGNIRITDAEELIDINNSSARARSAIGFTAKGNVVMLAVEGNNTAGGAGLSLPQLAQLMKEMTCTNALNLDGGGSTSLVVNGQLTVKPSDAGGERAVMSVLILKAR